MSSVSVAAYSPFRRASISGQSVAVQADLSSMRIDRDNPPAGGPLDPRSEPGFGPGASAVFVPQDPLPPVRPARCGGSRVLGLRLIKPIRNLLGF